MDHEKTYVHLLIWVTCFSLIQSYQKNGKRLKPVTKKQRRDPKGHEVQEAQKRYQEDYMDGMEIINLHKRCNKKAMNVSQPKKISKSDKPKKVSEPIDDLARKNRGLKKPMEKMYLQKQEKNTKSPLKRPHSLKNHQSLQSLLIQTQILKMNKNLW